MNIKTNINTYIYIYIFIWLFICVCVQYLCFVSCLRSLKNLGYRRGTPILGNTHVIRSKLFRTATTKPKTLANLGPNRNLLQPQAIPRPRNKRQSGKPAMAAYMPCHEEGYLNSSLITTTPKILPRSHCPEFPMLCFGTGGRSSLCLPSLSWRVGRFRV